MGGLISIAELERPEIEKLISRARELEDSPADPHGASGRAILLAFFEESVRTRVGFAAAAARLGLQSCELAGGKEADSMSEPEDEMDALLSTGDWFEAVCIRHSEPGFPAKVAEQLTAPVINCGDGGAEHPTQALIDLYAIERLGPGIDGARIALVGDLSGMRASHSLAAALSVFDSLQIRLIAPGGLELPAELTTMLVDAGHRVEVRGRLDLDGVDVVYVAGLPAETRSGAPIDAASRHEFEITRAALAGTSVTTVLAPLPRVDEIGRDLDGDGRAAYFAQSRLGLNVRMAILESVIWAD